MKILEFIFIRVSNRSKLSKSHCNSTDQKAENPSRSLTTEAYQQRESPAAGNEDSHNLLDIHPLQSW